MIESNRLNGTIGSGQDIGATVTTQQLTATLSAGTPGPPGPQGPAGPAGPIGPAGPVGPTGPQGTGIQVKGSVPAVGDLPTTGNQQGDAWITSDTGHMWVWSGTSWTDAGQVQGPPGPAGPQGPIGITGAAGPQGAQGPTGATGPIGATGPAGPTGATGATGPQGSTGIQGPIGPAGPAGSQGAIGPAGPTGATGPAGPQGEPGADSTVPGPPGPAGATGPAGPTGATGATGATGPQGPPGPEGIPMMVNGNIIGNASSGGGDGDVIGTLTVAAFDAATSNGTVQGGYDLAYLSDGFYTCVWTGTAWDYYFNNQRAVRPVIANFSAINSAAISNYGGALRVTAAANEQMRCAVVSLPAPPFTVKLAYIPLLHAGQADNTIAGGVWANATNLIPAGVIGRGVGTVQREMYTAKFTRPNTWNGDYYLAISDPWIPYSDVIYEELRDDGTNRTMRFGPAPGLMQIPRHTVSRTDFMTATQAGVVAHSQNANYGASVVLISFEITTP